MPSQYSAETLETPEMLTRWLAGLDENHLFALIDVQAMSIQQREELDAGCLGPVINLYGDLEGTEISRFGPRLIEVASDRHSAAISQAFALRSTSFLLGKCALSALAAHLQAIREVTVPESIQALFRYQDPQVASALFPIIDAARGSLLLGPLSAWGALDACNRLYILMATGKRPKQGALHFDQKIVDELSEQLFVHTVGAQVRDADSTLLAPFNACEAETKIRQRIAAARSLGLDQRADLSLYCILSLQFPEGFETHAPFAEALRYREHRWGSFAAALDEVASDVWDAWDARLIKEKSEK